MVKPPKKRTKKAPLTPEQIKQKAADKAKSAHIKLAQGIFTQCGFQRISALQDVQFTFKGTTCDFDDLFLWENVIIVAEYTSQKSDISGHLKKKKVMFDKITSNQAEFVEFLQQEFPAAAEKISDIYDPHQHRVVVVYASLHAFEDNTKEEVPSAKYLDYNIARYLSSVVQTIRFSARNEVFEFLGLDSQEIASLVLEPESSAVKVYPGSVLPEAHSNFGPGFKVVSFYVDPEALLARAYVFRKDGWRAGANLYQRMISKSKIDGIRKYLLDKQRVFINNVILTLPAGTKLLNASSETVDFSSIQKTAPIRIQIPSEMNCVGIIDGQHRLYSYYEGGPQDAEIFKLRKRQNLLATGIIYPEGYGEEDRARFEANLFLEINSTQTTAKSDLKHEIGLILRPFEPDSIAKRVLNRINDRNGPLRGEFQQYFYDQDKIKTTTIVSYGLRPLVKLGGDDSLFSVWENPLKEQLIEGKGDDILAEYVQFCATEINKFISAFKNQIPSDRWTTDKKADARFLMTTNINGMLSCLRRVIRDKGLDSTHVYTNSLNGADEFLFNGYKSSQYNKLGEALFGEFFV